MNKRISNTPITEKRLLSISEAQEYLSCGENKAREFAKECGAIVKIGTRVLIDKFKLDSALGGDK